jgi:ABC-type transport system involved in cytochrome c biogenesis permease subunit
MDKKIGLIAFGLLATLMVVMGFATIFEHKYGNAHAAAMIYESSWFSLLWIAMATTALYYLMATRILHKRLWVLLLHISFLIILLGALATRITGTNAQIHLRQDDKATFYIDEWTGRKVLLPFSISLQSFEIEYYDGTSFPSNYISRVEVSDLQSGNTSTHIISMNNILRYNGYRFYQFSYHDDLEGSILGVSFDRIGIPITYTGYYLMFFVMLLILFDKREHFNILRKKLLKKPASSNVYLFGLCLIWFVIMTFIICKRTYIGGRIPLSNTYETMLLLSWLSSLMGLFMRRISSLIVTFSLIFSVVVILAANLTSINPQINPLAPVLRSNLLSIHVLTIMIGYGLCGIIVLNSFTAIAIAYISNKCKDTKKAKITRMKEISELLMYPACFLIGAGIFIGAIWANKSWGRYWGWDPKEVWAIITFLFMGFSFHTKTLKWFAKPMFYHIFLIVIFLSVLMTYFGVNYIIGGLHSYAD